MLSMKALIIGCGGVGSVVGSWLKKDKDFDVDVLHKEGTQHTTSLLYSDKSTYIPQFTYITTRSDKALYDLIVVSTKSIDTGYAHRQAQEFIKPDGTILTIQSGLHNYSLDHPHHAKAIAYVNASKDNDGLVTVSSDILCLFIEDSPVIANLKDNNIMTDVVSVSNIEQHIREKLVHISAFSGIVCESGKTVGEIRSDTGLWHRYLGLLDECLAVASSQGYTFDRSVFESRLLHTPSNAYTSLYHDLLAGKKNEYHDLLGTLHTLAHDNNIPIPVMDSVDVSLRKSYLIS